MATPPFNVTVNTLLPLQVVEAVIFNDPNAPGANGNWNFANAPGVLTLNSQGGIVGTSGALRVRQVGGGGINCVVVFGYWVANGGMWIGAVGNIPAGQTTAQVLQDFYGGGQWNVQGQFWDQLGVFNLNDPAVPVDINIGVNNVGGVLDTVVNIV